MSIFDEDKEKILEIELYILSKFEISINENKSTIVWNHSFSTHAKYSEKLTFLTP